MTLADTVGGVTISGGPIATLAVGAVDTTTFSGSYAITQADIDAGAFLNTATVTGTDSNDQPVSDDDSHTEPLPQDPELTLVKSGTFTDESGDGFAQPGETISYTFSVTNSGNVTLTDVTLADTVGGVTISGGPIATLAVGAVDTTTFSGSYAITQADIDAGAFLNTATVTGTDPNDQPVSDDDSHTEPLPQDPELTLLKSGTFTDESGDGFAQPGETISYTFSVTNSGNVTLTDVTLADTVGGVTISGGPIATLAVGAVDTTTFSGSYAITQADIDAGAFLNTATVTGTDPNDQPVSDDDSHTEPLPQDPELTLVKSSTTTSIVVAGQVVPYSYLLTNTGNVTISALSVSDDNVDAPAVCVETTLAPAESTTCSASHTVTQAELDANGSPTPDSGVLTNIAIATGTPAGGTLTDPTDTLDIPIVQAPELTLVKSSTTTSIVVAGQVVPYSYLLTNTGNVTISALSVSDDNVDAPAVCVETTLAPAESTTCSASHTVTQAELDANGSPTPDSGVLTNVAIATGTPAGGTLTDPTDSLDIPIVQAPELTLVKSSTTTSIVVAGQVVPYSYLLTNTGNVTISALSVSDDNVDAPAVCVETTLAPAESTTCSASHTVTQAELDANGSPTPDSGVLTNVAIATGTPAGGTLTDPTDSLDIPIVQDPDIELLKTATPVVFGGAGDVITYTIIATNTGNVTLTNVRIDRSDGAWQLGQLALPTDSAGCRAGAGRRYRVHRHLHRHPG